MINNYKPEHDTETGQQLSTSTTNQNMTRKHDNNYQHQQLQTKT